MGFAASDEDGNEGESSKDLEGEED